MASAIRVSEVCEGFGFIVVVAVVVAIVIVVVVVIDVVIAVVSVEQLI